MYLLYKVLVCCFKKQLVMVEKFYRWRKKWKWSLFQNKNWFVRELIHFAYKNHTYTGKYGNKAQVQKYFMENEHLEMWFKLETYVVSCCFENIGYDSMKLIKLAPNLWCCSITGCLPCLALPSLALPYPALPHRDPTSPALISSALLLTSSAAVVIMSSTLRVWYHVCSLLMS